MNLRNCVKCGKVFVYINRNICPDCRDEEEQLFERVRNYLKDNPGSTIIEVSEKTGVPEEKIIRFLREGRIVSNNIEIGLLCESCGTPISSGYTCNKCKEQVRKGFRSITTSAKTIIEKSVSKDSDDDNKRMYTIERHKK